MRKYILFLFFTGWWLTACNDDISSSLPATDENTENNSMQGISEEDIVKGMMRIKLKKELEEQVAVGKVGGKVTTGIQALDRSVSALKINRIERTFPYTEKFEERTRREGLHLWYDVWYSEEISATRAADKMKMMEGIEKACPVRKIKTRSAMSLWDDLEFGRQWNFSNPGTKTWQVAGVDIGIEEVWKQYNGNPKIVVAVIDEGIDVDHPDLQANIWNNAGEIPGNGIDDDGNGYVDDVNGYNFYGDSPTMTPSEHGTHVTGIIAAVNNNGTGVCGIAGGDGTPNSGVKIMCCEILGPGYNNKGATAIKYAADNGAVICQNSWGYTGSIDPADKEAIDYFVKYAGCDNDGNQLPDSPMKGGIVLFATNNHNTSDPSDATPADYEKVIGIAALAPNGKKGSYSDYGDYVDISAPGGERPSNMGNVEDVQIYSTIENGQYGYLYGASMACPHVSGVAALIIEKHGLEKSGFTAGQLKKILLSTAYDIEKYNPEYTGLLGSGCVDATAALQAPLPDMEDSDNDGNATVGSDSFVFKSNPVTDGNLQFRVNHSGLAGEAVITIYNSIGAKVFRKHLDVKAYITVSVDIAKLASGYYIAEYECKGNIIRKNFIKY